MRSVATMLSHDEISLLLFALQGGASAAIPDAESCEEACPVVESVEELLCGGQLDAEHQLVRHLNNHLREAMIQSGVFELMAAAQQTATKPAVEDPARVQEVNQRLAEWKCPIKLNDAERKLLYESLSRLPRSSWVTMPLKMWRLRKKLSAG
jgi:hypothetical protein